MLYTKADSNRKLPQRNLSPRNQKLTMIQNIANRSPVAKFYNKQQITSNTLSSKNITIDNQNKNQKYLEGPNTLNYQKTASSSQHSQKFVKQTHQLGPQTIKFNQNMNPNEYQMRLVKSKKQTKKYLNFQSGYYIGQLLEDKPDGNGQLVFHSGSQFRGLFKNGIFIKGVVKYQNGDQYNGQLVNGLKNCDNGSYFTISNKTIYQGGWLNDKKHGKGVIIYYNGDSISGQFVNGQINENRQIIYKWKDSSQFYGWFYDGKPSKGYVKSSNGQTWQI